MRTIMSYHLKKYNYSNTSGLNLLDLSPCNYKTLDIRAKCPEEEKKGAAMLERF